VYELAFHPNVAKDLKSLDKSSRRRILDKIEWLVDHIEEMRPTQLTAQWEGVYRLRVGDYRVIYGIEQEQRRIIIYAVGHRREIYKLG
jgi:mRNA interferase RelE/StbE